MRWTCLAIVCVLASSAFLPDALPEAGLVAVHQPLMVTAVPERVSSFQDREDGFIWQVAHLFFFTVPKRFGRIGPVHAGNRG